MGDLRTGELLTPAGDIEVGADSSLGSTFSDSADDLSLPDMMSAETLMISSLWQNTNIQSVKLWYRVSQSPFVFRKWFKGDVEDAMEMINVRWSGSGEAPGPRDALYYEISK